MKLNVSTQNKTHKVKLVMAGFISLALSTGILINSMGQFILPIHRAMGYSIGMVSLAFSIISAGIIFAATFVAKFIDKYSPRVCMGISTGVIAVFALILSFTTQIWQFYACTVVMGLAFTGLHTLPVSVMINNAFSEKRKGLAISLAFSGSGVGGMVFNPIFNKVVGDYGWRTGFVIISCVYLVGGLLIIWLAKSPRTHIDETEYIEIEATEGYSVDPTENITNTDIPYNVAIRTRAFAFLCIGMLVTCGAGSTTMMHSVPYMISIGISPSRASFFISGFLLVLAVSKIVLGIICDRIGIAKGATLGMICYIGGVGIMLLLNISPMFYIAFLVVGGIGLSTATVTTPIMTSYLFGNMDYTRIFGLTIVFNGIGNCLLPFIMGLLFDITGSYTVGWCLLILLLSVVLVLYSINFRNPPRRNDHYNVSK